MTDILIFISLALLIGIFVLLGRLYKRSSQTEASVLLPRLDAFEKAMERIDRSLREEIGKNRDEQSKMARENRQEQSESFRVFGESVTQRIVDTGQGQKAQMEAMSEKVLGLSSATGERLDAIRAESASGAKLLREEVVSTLGAISESNAKAMGEFGVSQTQRLEAFTQELASFAKNNGDKLDAFRSDFISGSKQLREEVVTTQQVLSETTSKTMTDLAMAQKAQLDSFSTLLNNSAQASGFKLDAVRMELANGSKQLREEIVSSLTRLSEAASKTMQDLGSAQKENLLSFARESGVRLDAARSESAEQAKQLREEITTTIKALSDSIGKTAGDMAAVQKSQLETFSLQLLAFTKESGTRLDAARQESSTNAKQLREEITQSSKALSDGIGKYLTELASVQKIQLEAFSKQLSVYAKDSGDKLDGVRTESSNGAKQLREEVVSTLTSLSETITKTIGELSNAQRSQLEAFSGHVQGFAKESRDRLEAIRSENATGAKMLREEVVSTLGKISDGITQTMKDLSIAEKAQLEGFSVQVANLTKSSGEKLDGMRAETNQGAKSLREEVVQTLKGITEGTNKTMAELATRQQSQLEIMTKAIATLATTNENKLEAMRLTVEAKMQSMQTDNAKQLEQMRLTVDEKLQGTLEKRLGESFKQVSERLELVHKGLGEMQALATGVGDLKKVLTNVKTRGTWGEVQLGALLDQVLNTEQYAKNVSTKSGGERVEFAIKLPGQGSDEHVWLPIDAKFPIEDYQRLIEAQDRADADGIETAGKQLEARIKQCAADISEKYLNPPQTTDFGILYLPIEGLFAEVIRRSALTEAIQRQSRVVIAGPTTLWSILNSLQMGFRTLAIQKRSSEVWTVLGAVKTEWTKYGDVLEAVKKKLTQASETIDKAQVRSRAIGRKLKEVQMLPAHEMPAVLSIEPLDDGAIADDEESSATQSSGEASDSDQPA